MRLHPLNFGSWEATPQPSQLKVSFWLSSLFELCRTSRCEKSCKDGQSGGDDDNEAQRCKFSRDALAQLLKYVELNVHTRISVFDELFKLMSKLQLVADFSEFSRFYDFVFFMCREKGQKNITLSKAIAAWRLVLAGRFRLLNQWCDFVQENQRFNISEDTWQQVLAFSRCVHENLEGYDQEGAWPVLIDDFVEHMYRVLGSNKGTHFFCNCGDSEFQADAPEDHLPGLKVIPGLKRKLSNLQECMMSDDIVPECSDPNLKLRSKRNRWMVQRPSDLSDGLESSSMECMDVSKQNSPRRSSKSPCAVEGCLSKGFAGLFSNRSYLQIDLDKERRVSFT